MHISTLLSLPSAVLLLLCAATPALSAAEQQWPHNLPKHMKYFPEDERHVRRGIDIMERLRHEKPVGMKKMSTDEGEMFMLDNWIFASSENKRSEYEDLGNGTYQAQPAIRPNAADEWFERLRIRDVLLKRQFRCPEGTLSCASIGAPDVCCGGSSTCVKVQNSPIGDVGCCPNGQSCAGSISCNEAAGYSSCPGSTNGGCCLPGFQCSGIGCVAVGTSITYVQPSTSARPSTSTTEAVVPTSDASSAAPTTPPASTSTPAPSSSIVSSAYTCSTGWFSCPVSLGGGCCQNGRECATGASCVGGPSTSTQAPEAPVRPTSQGTTAVTSPASEGDVCPTGFYVCSAYYPSGCCRVGRDCQTTGSCIIPPSTTVLATNGVTIVAPTGASVATPGPAQGGSCPSAWFSCPAEQGGNCCPNGYACGEQCTATASGVSSIEAKVTPSVASFVPQWSVWGMLMAAGAIGAAMIAL